MMKKGIRLVPDPSQINLSRKKMVINAKLICFLNNNNGLLNLYSVKADSNRSQPLLKCGVCGRNCKKQVPVKTAHTEGKLSIGAVFPLRRVRNVHQQKERSQAAYFSAS